MHVISKAKFVEAESKHPNQANALQDLYKNLKNNEFATPEELKNLYKSLDNIKEKDKWYVIDIGGNNLRVIMYINFKSQSVYMKHIVTHSEYDELCKQFKKG
ncbi:MAG: type II toxin-antitoxin system HigB family toxin [Pseudomonadota bacterium]|nr:type II toxin-antitoxin system HigB family toxin [Pseudomonadota bacterium]